VPVGCRTFVEIGRLSRTVGYSSALCDLFMFIWDCI